MSDSRNIDPRTFEKLGEGNGTPLQYSCLENPMDRGAWWATVHGITEGWTQLSDFTFNFHFPALEREMGTHSSVLAWRIPGTGEPGGLPSMGLHRVRHDWSDLAATAATPIIGCPPKPLCWYSIQDVASLFPISYPSRPYTYQRREYISEHNWVNSLLLVFRMSLTAYSGLWPIVPVRFSLVTQSCPALRPHEPQHARPPCPSPN